MYKNKKKRGCVTLWVMLDWKNITSTVREIIASVGIMGDPFETP